MNKQNNTGQLVQEPKKDEPLITGSNVISRDGAGLRVTEYDLSERARQGLRTGVQRIK